MGPGRPRLRVCVYPQVLGGSGTASSSGNIEPQTNQSIPTYLGILFRDRYSVLPVAKPVGVNSGQASKL